MGRDEKDKRDALEDALEITDDTLPPQGKDGEQTVVDDRYLADLGARLDVPAPAEGEAPVTARPGYADVSTEKLDGEERERESRRKRRTSSYPAPSTSPEGELIYVLCGPDAGRAFLVKGERLRIGRGMDNDIVLNDPSVSRNHLALTRAVDGWLFEDLGSENGTYLDEEYVTQGKVLHGQPLEVGRTIVVFEKGRAR
jgi:hypothetical protein